MPNIGFLPINFSTFFLAYGTASGSPGPLERKMPSGFMPKTSSADVAAGTTLTRHPASAKLRRILYLIPKSYATTKYRGLRKDPFWERLPLVFCFAALRFLYPAASSHIPSPNRRPARTLHLEPNRVPRDRARPSLWLQALQDWNSLSRLRLPGNHDRADGAPASACRRFEYQQSRAVSCNCEAAGPRANCSAPVCNP